jgi:hypothetical protein
MRRVLFRSPCATRHYDMNLLESPTLSHPAFRGVDSPWIALFGPATAWIFPNLLVQKYLMDCIALASFTHSHAQVYGTVHSFWLRNRHSEKVPESPSCQSRDESFVIQITSTKRFAEIRLSVPLPHPPVLESRPQSRHLPGFLA